MSWSSNIPSVSNVSILARPRGVTELKQRADRDVIKIMDR